MREVWPDYQTIRHSVHLLRIGSIQGQCVSRHVNSSNIGGTATRGTVLDADAVQRTVMTGSNGSVTGNSIDRRCAPPILARANNQNCLNLFHIEKIAIDADKYCAFPGDRNTQYRYVGTIATQV
jgi:hypothetical protein